MKERIIVDSLLKNVIKVIENYFETDMDCMNDEEKREFILDCRDEAWDKCLEIFDAQVEIKKFFENI